jgi:hypothetical protein
MLTDIIETIPTKVILKVNAYELIVIDSLLIEHEVDKGISQSLKNSISHI